MFDKEQCPGEIRPRACVLPDAAAGRQACRGVPLQKLPLPISIKRTYPPITHQHSGPRGTAPTEPAHSRFCLPFPFKNPGLSRIFEAGCPFGGWPRGTSPHRIILVAAPDSGFHLKTSSKFPPTALQLARFHPQKAPESPSMPQGNTIRGHQERKTLPDRGAGGKAPCSKSDSHFSKREK